MIWHVYFGAIVLATLLKCRRPKRAVGIVLGLPLFSVGLMAWLSGNPFNAVAFVLLGVLVISQSLRLPKEPAVLAGGWILIAGLALFFFGLFYPHFLETGRFLRYLYAAPSGLIPCPTLSVILGVLLIHKNLDSRAFSLILGLAGIFYGLVGALRLGVTIDAVLLVGSLLVIILGFRNKRA